MKLFTLKKVKMINKFKKNKKIYALRISSLLLNIIKEKMIKINLIKINMHWKLKTRKNNLKINFCLNIKEK
jgi:hypothetical protein